MGQSLSETRMDVNVNEKHDLSFKVTEMEVFVLLSLH